MESLRKCKNNDHTQYSFAMSLGSSLNPLPGFKQLPLVTANVNA